MTNCYVIGVDPGPTPGVVRIDTEHRKVATVYVVQCNADAIYRALEGLTSEKDAAGYLAVEKFVTGRTRPSRSKDHEQARGMVANLYQWVRVRSYLWWLSQRAADVKPWATDARLDTVGLLEATKGMRHARDAARHALFAAVKLGLADDPLIGGQK